MTQEQPAIPPKVEINNEVECEIYSGRFGRLQGSPDPRFYLTLSMSAVQHARLVGLIGANLKGQATINVMNLQAPIPDEADAALPDVAVFQGKLRSVPTETETINTTVDGQPAKIKRSRVPNETAVKLAAMQKAAETPHVFDHNVEDGMCVKCGHAPDMPVHLDVPSYRDRVLYWQSHGGNNADEAMSENMAASVAADDAFAGDCLPMSDFDKAWYDALNGDVPVSEAAAKLISDAALTPATAG